MNRILDVLEQRGIKQTWLAEQLDKSYNMVNSYVKNPRQPSLDILYRIADILDIDVKDLLVSSKSEEASSKSESEIIKIPLLGDVACGTPILAVENIKAEIPISPKLLKQGAQYFILHAVGDSMDKSGINDGDLVLIKQQSFAENKDLIVALIDDEATIKEFYRQDNIIVLKPNSKNKKHQPIILADDFIIQGVVEKVINF